MAVLAGFLKNQSRKYSNIFKIPVWLTVADREDVPFGFEFQLYRI